MAKCKNCESQNSSQTLLSEYNCDRLGAPFPVILIDSVKVTKCDKCNSILGYELKDVRGLLAAVAITRALHPLIINGATIKFLRKSVNLTGKELSYQLGITPEYLSKCENNKERFSVTLEKYFRLLVCNLLDKHAPLLIWSASEISSAEFVRIIDFDSLQFKFTLLHNDIPYYLDTSESDEDKAHWKRAAEAA
jgi:transcriptional regulator with XRE-family HTH domain